MSQEFSLAKLMSNDADYAVRFQTQVKTIKKDKVSLLKSAADFNQEYSEEILEGTEKKKMLLENGKARGLTESEIFSAHNQFLPTVQTPILNFLYFLMRKYPNDTVDANEILREEIAKEQHFTMPLEDLKRQYRTLNDNDRSTTNISNENSRYGHLMEDDLSKNVSVPDMDEHIYDNLSVGDFNKIKKLKALSRSGNKQEAFSAYSKAMELCQKYNLNFDKIPCNV